MAVMADSEERAEGERVAPWLRRAILAVLALAFLGSGLYQAAHEAPTVDEGVDVSSGIVTVVRHDLRMTPEHPPLAKVPAAVGALIGRPIVPITRAYRDGRWFDYSDDFISANEAAGRLRHVLFWARAVALLEGLGCAALLYVLARRVFGPDGGLLVAGAWLTTPYTVGLSHFAMIDVPFTLITLACCVGLAWWRDAPSVRRAAVVGLLLGLALATRHTGLVLVLVAVGVMVAARWGRPRDAVREVVLAGLVAMITLWAVYRGLAPAGPSGAVAARFDAIIASASNGSAVSRLVTAMPMPKEWRAGFAYLDLTGTNRPASLFGQSWDGGRWWFFPASAFLKIPLTLTVAVVAGWVLALRRGARRPVDRRQLVAVVIAPALALWLFLLAQPLNLGLRLAMPVVALALVGLGGLATLRWSGRRWAALIVPLALLQLLASGVATPHSLAWTPPPWSPAYRWVSDANLDAGQALYEVRSWARSHDRPFVAIDTTRGMSVKGGSRSLLDVDPSAVRGWVAVGVTPLMQTEREELAWLRKYCPVATLGGGSVLIYRFEDAPTATPGPERPVPPCIGDEVSTDRS